jgi:hypothetical protein
VQRIRDVRRVHGKDSMTWREVWDASVLVMWHTLAMFVWGVVMLPTIYAIIWLYATFLEER